MVSLSHVDFPKPVMRLTALVMHLGFEFFTILTAWSILTVGESNGCALSFVRAFLYALSQLLKVCVSLLNFYNKVPRS